MVHDRNPRAHTWNILRPAWIKWNLLPIFRKVTSKDSSKAFPQEIHFIADITTANDEVSWQKDLILNSNQHHQLLAKN